MLSLDQNLNLLQNVYQPLVEGQISLRSRCIHRCLRRQVGSLAGHDYGTGVASGTVSAGRVGELYTNGMRPICFLSDFGSVDDFAGTCKGVMLRISPGVSIVDLTHEVPGFGVEAGAEILQHATRYMPSDAVYLALVDPDNGLLIDAAESLGGISGACALTEERFHLHPVSNTFHGRDVFAPVAAHLAAGVGFSELGEPVDPASLVSLGPASAPPDEGGGLTTRILSID